MVLSKMKKTSLLLLLAISVAAFADSTFGVATAYYFPDHDGYNNKETFAPVTYDVLKAESDNQRDLGSSWGSVELQGTYEYKDTKPFLVGGTSLTSDNNLTSSYKFGITPVDINIGANFILTPIAFLQFSLGTTFATGWKAIGVYGLALYDNPIKEPDNSPFQGVYNKTWLTGTFQFDTSAVLSGDKTWKHILLLSSHTLNFAGFSAADNDQAWIYQAAAPAYNGFKYKTTNFLGYKMPLILNTTGLLIETEKYIFDVAEKSKIKSDNGGWGSDFTTLTIGWLFNFTINENSSFVILPQIQTKRNYTDETAREKYFTNRVVDKENSYYWDFHRIAFTYSYKF